MYKIKYDDEEFEYKLMKSKRKTVEIRITNEGEVVVKAPLRANNKAIEEIVVKKAEWILEKLKFVKENQINIKKKEFVSGEKISLLGKEYELKVEEEFLKCDSTVSFHGNCFNVKVNRSLTKDEKQQCIKEVLVLWMRKKAAIVFKERTALYAEKLKLYPNRITIKEQKTRWGSCSSKDNINYNWKLVMAPLEILDSVVVHELCHLKHRNHSKEYWDFVKTVMPDYDEKKQWLKVNGGGLGL